MNRKMDFMNTVSAAQAAGGQAMNGKAVFSGFATDSRDVKEGDMFLCIRGERTDGHLYVASAEENGASCFFCEEEIPTKLPYIKVPSVVEGLQKMALAHRKTRLCETKIAAVTGSVGKTTTKEFTAAVLSEGFSTYKTRGNKNSETGLPITILETERAHGAAVTEMGMSGLGEISVLSKIALPDIGIITNIGLSHIEHLKTRENILKAKTEIIDGMAHGSPLLVNGDDDLLSCWNGWDCMYRFAVRNPDADFRAEEIEAKEDGVSFTVVFGGQKVPATIPLTGVHNVYNALAAVGAGVLLGIPLEKCVNGLKNYVSSPMRQKIYETKGFTIFEDCYNAVPDSVIASLAVLRRMKGRKIALLGDMLELGEMSADLHRMVGENLNGIDRLVCYGDYAEDYAAGARKAGLAPEMIYIAANREEALQALLSVAEKGDAILFKASRGMHAEEVLQNFIAAY